MSPQRDRQSEMWAQIGFYTSLGFIIPGGVIVGYVLGWLIDQWVHTTRIFALIFAFLGAAGGVAEILLLLTRAEKRADKDESDNGGPGA